MLNRGVFVLLTLTFLTPGSSYCQEEEENNENPVVVIKTSMGDIVAELYPERAPESVANFLAYVDSGFYRGTIFHRVIKGFMIQGGGFNAAMQRLRTREPIHNEARNGLKNRRGTLAMARVRGIHSATSQFFINTSDNRRLDNKGPTPDDYGYAVFGTVIEGMEVAYAIEKVKTTKKAEMPDVPEVPVVIIGIERRTATEEAPKGRVAP